MQKGIHTAALITRPAGEAVSDTGRGFLGDIPVFGVAGSDRRLPFLVARGRGVLGA